MKILIDECLPSYLKTALTGTCQTVQEAGWSSVKNGPLLARAERSFDVFLTADQNLRYQQNKGFDEIATEIGRTVEATRQLLQRTRVGLKECIDRSMAQA